MKTILKVFGILLVTAFMAWFGYWLGVDILTDAPDLSHPDKMFLIGVVEFFILIMYALMICAVIAGLNELPKKGK